MTLLEFDTIREEAVQEMIKDLSNGEYSKGTSADDGGAMLFNLLLSFWNEAFESGKMYYKDRG